MEIISNAISDFILSIKYFIKAPRFIKKHRLWSGFSEHKIVALALIVVGLIFGWRFYTTITDWWTDMHVDGVLDAGAQAATLMGTLATSSYDMMFAGAYKYVVLIVMELLIFHMALRTNRILTGKQEELTASLFINAQLRMIKVSLFTFIMELIVGVGAKIVLSIAGADFLETPVVFLIQCFFLGFALIDNFNEIRQLDVKASYKHTLNFPGAAIGIGLILYILILIPIIGPIVGPMLGAVAATLLMHELSDRHPIELEDEKMETEYL